MSHRKTAESFATTNIIQAKVVRDANGNIEMVLLDPPKPPSIRQRFKAAWLAFKYGNVNDPGVRTR